MKNKWKDEIKNSLITASILKAGQPIRVLRNVAGANSFFEERQVSRYVSMIANYQECTKVWSLKRDYITGNYIIPK